MNFTLLSHQSIAENSIISICLDFNPMKKIMLGAFIWALLSKVKKESTHQVLCQGHDYISPAGEEEVSFSKSCQSVE